MVESVNVFVEEMAKWAMGIGIAGGGKEEKGNDRELEFMLWWSKSVQRMSLYLMQWRGGRQRKNSEASEVKGGLFYNGWDQSLVVLWEIQGKQEIEEKDEWGVWEGEKEVKEWERMGTW